MTGNKDIVIVSDDYLPRVRTYAIMGYSRERVCRLLELPAENADGIGCPAVVAGRCVSMKPMSRDWLKERRILIWNWRRKRKTGILMPLSFLKRERMNVILKICVKNYLEYDRT